MSATLAVRLIEPLVFVASIIVLVKLSLPYANPLLVTFRPVVRTFTRRNYFIYIMIGLAVILADTILTAIDHRFTERVVALFGQDFTELIWRIEGEWVAVFQRWTWAPLTWFLAWAYVIVFSAAVPWTMAVFDYLGETRRNVAVLVGYIMNYLLVLPFYIAFPVRECHAYAPGGRQFVRLALDDLHPAIMQVLRPLSGIDNCFPSFHTSLVVTMALFAWDSGRKAFAAVMSVMMISIMFSTLYLGIHWATDVAAGVVVGVLAWFLGERLGGKLWARWSRRSLAAD